MVGRRPSPQIAQMKRTLYFLSRNTLAIVGLAIVLFIVSSRSTRSSTRRRGYLLETDCGTFSGSTQTVCPPGYTSVCTYDESAPPPNVSVCYPVDKLNPSQVAPTWNFNPAHLSAGPLRSDP